jgi:hypothetical protein
VKPGREGPTVPVQLCDGLRNPNRIVTPVGTTTIHMAGGAVSMDNAPTPHRWLCLGPPPIITGKRPLWGLYSPHTGSHYIYDPPDMGPYVQQENIQFYHTICKSTNNIREVIG